MDNPAEIPKPVKSKLIRPENTLKKKVGSGGFDQTVLAKAQDSLENNTVDFKPIALEFGALIHQVLVKMKAGDTSNQDGVNQIMDSVMQLNAQGTLFHYPLITRISRILVDFLEDKPEADKNIIDIVDGYKNSINVIATMQLKDSNHPAGKELCKALSDACGRYDRLKSQQAQK